MCHYSQDFDDVTFLLESWEEWCYVTANLMRMWYNVIKRNTLVRAVHTEWYYGSRAVAAGPSDGL